MAEAAPASPEPAGSGRPRCSAESRRRGDPLSGTASHVRNWLLLEQPGAWGIDALFESRLPREVARALHDRAHALKIRVVLIRRPDRRPDGVNVFLAHTGGTRTRPALFHGVLDDPASLLDLDLRPLMTGRPVGFGHRVDEPLFLVCTNGRHDVCCAERGRPAFEALAATFPDRTWEVSHIGGDRFAGNLVFFPHGIYYGWVEPAEASVLGRAYERGELDLGRYRGRSSWPVEVQAAEHAVRQELGLTRVDALVPVTRVHDADGTVEVTFRRAGGERYAVRVRPQLAESLFLTCRAGSMVARRNFVPLSVERI